MNRYQASRLLAESCDRPLADEKRLFVDDNACAAEPFPRVRLTEERKLETELLIQSAMAGEAKELRKTQSPEPSKHFRENNGVSEVCAVSRRINDAKLVKKVPNGRLGKMPEKAGLDGAQGAGPGDVVLSGEIPVFEDGRLFGFLSIKVEPNLALSHGYANQDSETLTASVLDRSLSQVVGTAIGVCASTTSCNAS